MSDSADFRRGCAIGARATYDSVIADLPAPIAREVEDWLGQLDRWAEGPMPDGPKDWER